MAVRRRSLLIVAVAVAALVVAVPGIAVANYSIHGSYTMSTDACAGCHRAHTAASSITWVDTDGADQSALLLSTAATIDEFCYTCHGTAALGADTNVYDGVFEADDGVIDGDRTYNAFGEALNGGGFDPSVFWTQHYPSGVTWVAYGGGTTGRDGIFSTGGVEVDISCTVCHDVHGSSNYRLLKDEVNSVQVGGYDDTIDPVNPTPTPWVISAEDGYPTGGWLLHEPGAADVSGYSPDYTTPKYGKAPGGDKSKGISAWCAACHTQYTVTDSVYDANDGFGLVARHRHPVNTELENFLGYRSIIVTANVLPLAHDSFADAAANDADDWVDCLTCHYAHGSSSLMTGYASVADATDPLPDSGNKDVTGDGVPDAGYGSVPPANGNALLRGNNRFVCESCHNK